MFLMVPQHSKSLFMGILSSSKPYVIVPRCTEGVTVLRIQNVVKRLVNDGTVDPEQDMVDSAEIHGKVIFSVETNWQRSFCGLIPKTLVSGITVIIVLALLLGCIPGKLYVLKILLRFVNRAWKKQNMELVYPYSTFSWLFLQDGTLLMLYSINKLKSWTEFS